MLSGFHASCADFDAAAGRQARPLEVGIFSGSFCGIIMPAEQPSRSHYYGPFFANCAGLCHNTNLQYIRIILTMNQVLQFIFQIAVLIFSVIIHEVSHGAVAYALGDSTAKDAGRLTLNPIPHIDFVGSILLPAFIGFGWAKPVPYNPYNLKSQKWGPLLVGLAGPASNILIALFFGLSLRFFGVFSSNIVFFVTILSIVKLNLGLAVFNLIPIPPLDGSKLLFAILPYGWIRVQEFLERYGFFVLLILIFLVPGFLSGIIFPIVNVLISFITGLGI